MVVLRFTAVKIIVSIGVLIRDVVIPGDRSARDPPLPGRRIIVNDLAE